MVAQGNKRVQISVDQLTLQLLEDMSWSEKMTKSEFIKMLILEHSQKENGANEFRGNRE